jgi:IclR family pca regulon transcriptional regulator
MEAATAERDFVQSLARGLTVVRALARPGSGSTLAEVAREAGFSRAATRRFLLTLQELGYVRGDGRIFALTPRVLELGYAYLSALTLPELAQPHLEGLVQRVHESSSVSVLDGRDVVYVARVPTRRIMAVAISVGTRFPAHATSMGRVLLAGLPAPELRAVLGAGPFAQLTPRTVTRPADLEAEVERVRERGWALVDQELEEGLRSIAVPIRDAAGSVVAAMNCSSTARRPAEDMRRTLLPELQEAAAAVERDLAARAPGQR